MQILMLEDKVRALRDKKQYEKNESIAYSGYVNRGFGFFIPKVIVCFRCYKVGHNSKFHG